MFKQIPKITGSNLYLRNVQPEDASPLLVWRSDPELGYLAGVQKIDRAGIEAEINSALNSEKEAFIMIVKRADDEPIGYIRLNCWFETEKIVWLRVVVGRKDLWNRGYGAEAIKLLLNWLFDKQGVHKVECETFVYNARALYFFEKIGFKPEGVRRSAHFYEGSYYDVVMFGLLREDLGDVHKNYK